VSDVGGFLAAVTPVLIDLGRELFTSTGGDVAKARKVIRSRIAEVKRERSAIDAEAKRRFGR
jgi:hypothetical protein